jgi:hypothetical protein
MRFFGQNTPMTPEDLYVSTNLHSSDPDFFTSLTAALHSEYPKVGILAEYFTDDCTLLNTGSHWGLNLILATPWNSKFAPQLCEYLKYVHSLSDHIRYFITVTSQDSGSPAQEFGTSESTVPRYVAPPCWAQGPRESRKGWNLGKWNGSIL